MSDDLFKTALFQNFNNEKKKFYQQYQFELPSKKGISTPNPYGRYCDSKL